MYNLYQTVIQFSKNFKNPYFKQINKQESKTIKNPIELNVNVENYLLMKPREGKAFVPDGTSKMLDDLSFIPIEKIIFKEQKPLEQCEKLIDFPKSTDLFSIHTKPLNIEDIGESVERKTISFRQTLRYHGLKMKKLKPNQNRKFKKVKRTDVKME